MTIKMVSEEVFSNLAIAGKTLNWLQVSLVQQPAGDGRRAEPCLTPDLDGRGQPGGRCSVVGIRECGVCMSPRCHQGIPVLCAAMPRELTYHFGVHTCLGIARPEYSGLLQMQGLQPVTTPCSPPR